MTTNTARTLKYLRDHGYQAEVVERYLSFAKRRKDLFDIIDIIAIDGKNITHWLSRTPRRNPWMPWVYGYTWDAVLAWEGCTTSGEPVNLQAYEWTNPRPEDPIVSVEMLARQDVPGLKIGLVALTAVR